MQILSNDLQWIGGNAVFLSNSVRNTTVTGNLFRWLGTNGVAVQGKTGVGMMDGRDGEAMMARHGSAADNGVRLPKDNLISHNIFADYGIWDKQSACYHKALAPGNLFLNNVCFNSSVSTDPPTVLHATQLGHLTMPWLLYPFAVFSCLSCLTRHWFCCRDMA